jgi:hypothetical protein
MVALRNAVEGSEAEAARVREQTAALGLGPDPLQGVDPTNPLGLTGAQQQEIIDSEAQDFFGTSPLDLKRRFLADERQLRAGSGVPVCRSWRGNWCP